MNPDVRLLNRLHPCTAAGPVVCTMSAGSGLSQRLASITIRKLRFCATGSLQNELPL